MRSVTQDPTRSIWTGLVCTPGCLSDGADIFVSYVEVRGAAFSRHISHKAAGLLHTLGAAPIGACNIADVHELVVLGSTEPCQEVTAISSGQCIIGLEKLS